MDSDPRVRALISLLATSGLRIGEAAQLRIGNLNLDEEKVTVMARKTKSRSMRITFISSETAKLLRDYLRSRMNDIDAWLFPDTYQPEKPAGRNALYQLIRRALVRDGLRTKLDPDSRMYELHPHCFRKYFFTKLISAGVDRGVAEYLMGHRFGLDNSYLRMDEDHLRKEYQKAEDDFIFLQDRKPNRESKERMDELQNLLKLKDAQLTATNERLSRLEGKFETILKSKFAN
jgi:integrase